MDIARRMYASRPTYTLDHLVKERYPRFADALGDCDDALSMLHLFASFPAAPPIKPEVTAMAKRLCREWQYFCVRAHALRKVFFSIKGIYFQAEVEGVAVTWLQPWQFSQALPCDVDYKVMLTFLELHEVCALVCAPPRAANLRLCFACPLTHSHEPLFTPPQVLLKFTLYKLYHGLGLAYPPTLRADREDGGAHLTALEVQRLAAGGPVSASADAAPAAAAAAPKAAAGAGAADAGAAARLASLPSALAAIAAQRGATEEGAGASAAGADAGALPAAFSAPPRKGKSASARGPAAAAATTTTTAHYDFVEDSGAAAAAGGGGGGGGSASAPASAPADGDDAVLADLAEFSGSAEATSTIAKARALRHFQGLFAGCVFFLGREIPRESFEFLICAFAGRLGWEGPGSPYAQDDARITHAVCDRPAPPSPRAPGREYIAPQWVADCINARMLLPVTKYAPGMLLPPHLSPFVDDGAEGYVPAYRAELDALRSAAAVTGRLADLIRVGEVEGGGRSGKRVSRMGEDADAMAGEEEGEGEGEGDGAMEEELDDDDDEEEEEEEEEEGDDDDDDEEEEEEDIEALMQSAVDASQAKGGAGRGGGGGKGLKRPRDDSGAGAAGVKAALASRMLEEKEEERRALAVAMLSHTQRKIFTKAMGERKGKEDSLTSLANKRAAAAVGGDKGVGGVAAAAAAAAAAAGAAAGKQGAGKQGAGGGAKGAAAAAPKPPQLEPSAAGKGAKKMRK